MHKLAGITSVFVVTVLILFTVGCRDHVANHATLVKATKEADTGSSMAEEEKKADDGKKTESKGATVEKTEENASNLRKKRRNSRYHPAAFEEDYNYISEVWEDDDERKVIDYLKRAITAEKGYRIVRKNKKKYLPMLRRSIRARHREVRIQTAVILGLLKDKSDATFKVLRDSLLLDSDPDVRAIAAKAFVVLKKKESVDALIRSLNDDPYDAARANAAWALGSIGNREAVPHLRAATKDEDTFVRLRALSALLKIRSKESIPELIERLEDRSPMVRDRAREALKKIIGVDKGKERSAWEKAFGEKNEGSTNSEGQSGQDQNHSFSGSG